MAGEPVNLEPEGHQTSTYKPTLHVDPTGSRRPEGRPGPAHEGQPNYKKAQRPTKSTASLDENNYFSPSPRLLDAVQAGRYLSVSPWMVRSLAWRGLIPSVKIGRRVRYDRVDLDRYVDLVKVQEAP